MSSATGGGMIVVVQGVVISLSVVAAFTDLTRGKIYNWMTLPSVLAGILFSGFAYGWQGGLSALGAVGVALLVFGLIYFLKVISAGDVKFLMALGAWGGVRFTLDVAFLSLMIGGVFALILLIIKRQMPAFLAKLRRLVLSLTIKELEVEFPKANPDLKMPYGLPMSLAAVALIVDFDWLQKIMGALRFW